MGSISTIRKPPHQKCFGVELECYYAGDGTPVQRRLWAETNRVGFWEATYDGSLSFGGLEWVCQPMPYNMLIKSLNSLAKKLGGWRVDNRCGLHIHVSRGYWSDKREQAFTKFLCSLGEDQLIELFGRSSEYARPGAFSDSKYRAVNLLHSATYEFRLWKAGDLAWTLEAIRRTRLIVEHRGKWSYEQCLELFTKPSEEPAPKTPLVNLFNSVVNQPPQVRRVRRATPEPTTLGELLRSVI